MSLLRHRPEAMGTAVDTLVAGDPVRAQAVADILWRTAIQKCAEGYEHDSLLAEDAAAAIEEALSHVDR